MIPDIDRTRRDRVWGFDPAWVATVANGPPAPPGQPALLQSGLPAPSPGDQAPMWGSCQKDRPGGDGGEGSVQREPHHRDPAPPGSSWCFRSQGVYPGLGTRSRSPGRVPPCPSICAGPCPEA